MAGIIASTPSAHITASRSLEPGLGVRRGLPHGTTMAASAEREGLLHGTAMQKKTFSPTAMAASAEGAANCLPCSWAKEPCTPFASSTSPLPTQLSRRHSVLPLPTQHSRRDSKRRHTFRVVMSAGARGREQGWAPLGGRSERRVAPVWRLPTLTLTFDKSQIDPQQVHRLMLLTGYSPYAFNFPRTSLPLEGNQSRESGDQSYSDPLPQAQDLHLDSIMKSWSHEPHESSIEGKRNSPESARESLGDSRSPKGWMGSLPGSFQAPPLLSAADVSQAQYHQHQQQRDQRHEQQQQREQEHGQQQQHQLPQPLTDGSSQGLLQHSGHRPLSIKKLRKALKHSTVVVGLQVKLKSLDWDYMEDAPGENSDGSNSNSHNPNAMRLVAFVRASSDASLTAAVHDLVVHPDFQGFGLGQRVMQRMVRELQRYGIGDIALLCQPELCPYFKRLGFASDRMRTTTMMFTQEPRASLYAANTAHIGEEPQPRPWTEAAVEDRRGSEVAGPDEGDLSRKDKPGQAVQASLELSSEQQPSGGSMRGLEQEQDQEQFVVWGSKLLRVRSGLLLPPAKVQSLEELLRNLSPEDEGCVTARETKRTSLFSLARP